MSVAAEQTAGSPRSGAQVPSLRSSQHETSTELLRYVKRPEVKRLVSKFVRMQEREGFKSVAVLSSNSGEGKTLFISALALCYSLFMKKRVLLLDSVQQSVKDSFYYRSFFPEGAGAGSEAQPNTGGLEVITTRSLQACQDQLDPAGEEAEPVVSDFLLAELVSNFARDFDLVLIDTCAIEKSKEGTVDPLVLASQADGAVLLLSSNAMKRREAKNLSQLLEESGIQLLATLESGLPGGGR